MRIKFLRPRTTAGLRFRQVGKSSSAGRSWKRQRRFQSVSAYLNNWPDQLNADPLCLWVLGAVLVDQGRWLAFINSKGLKCPSFRSLMKSLDTWLGAVTELQEPNSPE